MQLPVFAQQYPSPSENEQLIISDSIVLNEVHHSLGQWTMIDKDSFLKNLSASGRSDQDYKNLVDDIWIQLGSYFNQVDWDKRESIIAKMRNVVKVILRKNDYPENGREAVVEGLFIKSGDTLA
jgi:hypothetical protein